MPSPTDFNLLSSAPKGGATQTRERPSGVGSGTNDFQRLMDKPPRASSSLEQDARSRSKPRLSEAEPERQPALSRDTKLSDKPSPLAANETGSSSDIDSKASEGLTTTFSPEQAGLSEAKLADDWLPGMDSLETLVQLDGVEQPVSPDASGLSLDQLLERLTQTLKHLDATESDHAQELRSLVDKIEQGVALDALPALMQQLSVSLAGLVTEQKGLPGGSQQLVAQLQGLQKEVNNFQFSTNTVDTNGSKEPPLKLDGESKLSWSKIASGLDENPDARLLDKIALDKSEPKPSNIITQLSGAELSNNRIPQLQPAERSFMVQSDVRVPVGQPQWSQAVGERVLWLAAQNLTSAELRLDPPDLGPMQVRVSMNNDQVNVSFSSQQVAVREALDQGAQRLREMFNEQGLKLGDLNVSDQSEGRQFNRDRDSEGQGRRRAGAGEEDEAPLVQSQLVTMRLVDHYA